MQGVLNYFGSDDQTISPENFVEIFWTKIEVSHTDSCQQYSTRKYPGQTTRFPTPTLNIPPLDIPPLDITPLDIVSFWHVPISLLLHFLLFSQPRYTANLTVYWSCENLNIGEQKWRYIDIDCMFLDDGQYLVSETSRNDPSLIRVQVDGTAVRRWPWRRWKWAPWVQRRFYRKLRSWRNAATTNWSNCTPSAPARNPSTSSLNSCHRAVSCITFVKAWVKHSKCQNWSTWRRRYANPSLSSDQSSSCRIFLCCSDLDRSECREFNAISVYGSTYGLVLYCSIFFLHTHIIFLSPTARFSVEVEPLDDCP